MVRNTVKTDIKNSEGHILNQTRKHVFVRLQKHHSIVLRFSKG